jgi:hypothetical protein
MSPYNEAVIAAMTPEELDRAKAIVRRVWQEHNGRVFNVIFYGPERLTCDPPINWDGRIINENMT